MANSIIKKPNILKVEDPPNMISIQSNTENANFKTIAYRKYGSVVQARFEFQTKRELTAGNSYVLGTMSGTLPTIVTYVPTFRQDGSLQGGWVILPTNQDGNIYLISLTTIPSGVLLTIPITYITTVTD